MRHLVVGTAGHIDHGKSALVLALTGTDPDRLEEEKRRGITIDLGFADLKLAADLRISFIDVPGHERFVRHMVAGATGFDAVLLVVAADQGVQPQTREHMNICRLLDIPDGIVALTKCDLVDAELLDVARLELAELLQPTWLAAAPVVPVSARTGQGLDALRAALAALAGRTTPRPSTGVARLPIDRSFVLRGFGTVVTGTLVAGSLGEGDEVEILPGSRRGRIRGLHVHGERVTTAAAGRRVAVNLQGLDRGEAPRGATLTRRGGLSTTRRLWARVTLVDEAPQALRRGGPLRFHQGTCERAARMRVLDAAAEENDELRVELHLDEPTVLAPGDRFVLRRPSPVDTVGGGIVVDVRPPRSRESSSVAFSHAATSPSAALRSRMARAASAGADASSLATELGLSTDELAQRAEEIEQAGELVRSGSRWFDGDVWRGHEKAVLAVLGEFHREEPLRLGMPREELRARAGAGLPMDAWRRMLDGLSDALTLRLEGERVALYGHEVVLDGEAGRFARAIETRFRTAGLEPPDPSEVTPPGRLGERVLELLLARGELVRIPDGKVFHRDALAELRGRLREYATRSPTIDVGAFKDLAGVTRKHAIPLLEYLDASRVTLRRGNLREILEIRDS